MTKLRLIFILPILLLALGVVGCSSSQKVAFDISVKNESDRPITIWLTKSGTPAELGWHSPEQVAMQSLGHEERTNGTVVDPGKTASTGPIVGHFDRGSYPWLRIYDGKYADFTELLAVPRFSPKRIDQPIRAGVNRITVKDRSGTLYAETGKPERMPDSGE